MEEAIVGTKNKQKPLFAFNVVLIAFLIAAFFVREYPSFINSSPYPLWNPATFWLMVVAFWVMGFWVVFLAQKHFHPKRSPVLISLFSLTCIGVLVTYISLPDNIEPFFSWQTSAYSFGLSDKFYYAVGSLHTLVGVYVLFTYAPLGRTTTKGWRIVFEIFALVALASIVYSLIAEASTYQRIFATHKIEGWRSPSSWTPHKNAYGRLLLVGVMSELYLFYLDRHYWRYIFVLAFGFAMGLAAAKTPLILAVVFTMSYSAFEIIRAAIRHKRISIFHTLILSLFVLALLLTFLVPTSSLGGFGQLLEELRKSVTHGSGGTIDARINIWQKCMALWSSDSRSTVFGFGDYPYPLLIAEAMDFSATSGTTHNYWLEALGRGGIVRLSFEVGLTLYVIYRLILGIRKKKHGAFLAALFFTGLLFQSALESVFLFNLSMESIFFFALTGMIILPEYNETFFANQNQSKLKVQTCLSFFAFILCPTFISISLLIPNLWASLTLFLCVSILQILLGRSAHGMGIIMPFAIEIVSIPLTTLYPYCGQLDWLAVVMFVLFVSVPPLAFVGPNGKAVAQCGESLYATYLFRPEKRVL